MAATPPPLQTTFIHASAYSSLFLQVLEHLFPDRKLPALSEDERRIVQNETDNLLVRSRWRIESYVFVNQFEIPQQPATSVAPADTVLGAPPAPPEATKPPGQYV
jgi:hypothetical protein